MLKNNRILLSLSVATLLGVGGSLVESNFEQPTQVVQAATKTKKLTHTAYVYKANGTRYGKKKIKKGKKVRILGTKKIKGKKYYRIGKNQYVKIANFKKGASITSVSSNSSSNVSSSSSVSENTSSSVSSSKGNYTITTDKNGNKVITGKKSSNGGNKSGSISSSSKGNNSSTNNSSEYVGDPNKSNVKGDNGELLSTRWRSTFYGPMTAAQDANRKKYGYKHVYFSDSELQRLEKRLWQDIQNYRKSKGYSAFKTNPELTRLAQQSQVPGTAEFNRFNDKMSQNTDEIKSYLPTLASKGLDQAIGYVDSTAYGENYKGIYMGGDVSHSGRTPEQAADAIFEYLKNSDGFQSKLIYGWKEHNAYAALSVHYFYDKQATDGSAVGISFFTADGTSSEWINFWKNN